MPTSSQRPAHVVIVGGGFGGLNAAKQLENHSQVRVTLIDRRNHHLFQPLLYQVATAGLSPADIAMPIRSIVRSARNIEVRLDEVTAVLAEQNTVHTQSGRSLTYDFLILACGANHSYFGHPEWEQQAPGLKTLEQATEIRRRILTAFERAELEPDPTRRKELLTFVIVGGGPTGVELAGAIGEISRFTLSRDFRHIDPSRTRVILVEGSPRILSAFSPELSRKASRSLEQLGVTVWTSVQVTGVTEEGVALGSEFVRAGTVLWAAGVEAAGINRKLPGELDRQNRILVAADLSLPGHSNVFVIGDQARSLDELGQPLPGLAPVAMQQGRAVAANILAELRGKPRVPFHYFDKGMMATIGRGVAVAQTGKVELSGLLAWLAWCFIHVLYLIGFRNRMSVMLQWLWSYVRYRRGARLITEPMASAFHAPQASPLKETK